MSRLETELRVVQTPVSVDFECPCCDQDVSVPYRDFTAWYGDPPDWTCKTIFCPECGCKIDVSSVDWD